MALFLFFYWLVMEEKEFAARNVETVAEKELSLKGAVFNSSLGKGGCCRGKELVDQRFSVGHGEGMGRRAGRLTGHDNRM